MGQNFQTGDVRIERIDDAPAAAVRAGLDDKLVVDYAELLANGVEFADPAVAFGYPGDGGRLLYLLADGRHRTRACLKVGREVIRCRYEVCDTREEAERRAYEFAAGANESHGKRRSDEDKRAAVTMALLRPEWAEKSNIQIAALCNVSKHMPGKIRRELTAAGTLTGRAAFNHPKRKFKINATYGGGRQYDDKGGTKGKADSAVGSAASGSLPPPSPEPTSPTDSAPDCDDGIMGNTPHADEAWRDALIADRMDVDAATARTLRLAGVTKLGQLRDKLASNEPIGAGISTEAKDYLLEQLARIAPPEIEDGVAELPADEPHAVVIGRATDQAEADPAPVMIDEKGRPVPPRLVPVFEKRREFRAFSQWVAQKLREVEGWSREPFGKALCLNPIRNDAGNFSKGVAGARPYVVCPSCDGDGMQGKTVCPTCSNKGDAAGRGWLSRMRHQQLTPELKRVCEGWGKRDTAA
jgi:hypothetical protein